MAEVLARATGRRKRSRAQVRIMDGEPGFNLNGKRLEEYFPTMAMRVRVLGPLRAVEMEGRYAIHAKLEGGGTTGQIDALRLGIARALEIINPELRDVLKKGGYLTRDPRRVEPKKYGLRKARRAPQYTKR